MNDLLKRYLDQKEAVERAQKEVDKADQAYQQADYNLSMENAILDRLARDIAESDDPIIKAIRELYQSGELK